jgi:hypothetical protein
MNVKAQNMEMRQTNGIIFITTYGSSVEIEKLIERNKDWIFDKIKSSLHTFGRSK